MSKAAVSPSTGPKTDAHEHLHDGHLHECHDCGLVQAVPDGPHGGVAKCSRCEAVLRRYRDDPINPPLAYALTGLVLLTLAVSLPFLSFSLEGAVSRANLLSGVSKLFRLEMYELSGLVLLTIFLAPLALMSLVTYAMLGLKYGWNLPGLVHAFRLVGPVKPWGMIEVFLLGLMVAYVKLADLADMNMGLAVLALAALMFVTDSLRVSLDHAEGWHVFVARGLLPPGREAMAAPMVGCETCGLVNEADKNEECGRCGAPLVHRKADSLSRTLALCLAGVILYVPANAFPVMTIISFGKSYPSTILGGVEELMTGGMWPLALLVFFASITVPMLKLIGLLFLLFLTWRRSAWRLKERTQLYRIIEGVGRWSMIDVFAVSILVSLVQLGAIATILPGLGASCFAAVVVVTMIAASSFDPRLMWDRAGQGDPWTVPEGAHGDALQSDVAFGKIAGD